MIIIIPKSIGRKAPIESKDESNGRVAISRAKEGILDTGRRSRLR